jgi:hypothetical protein
VDVNIDPAVVYVSFTRTCEIIAGPSGLRLVELS